MRHGSELPPQASPNATEPRAGRLQSMDEWFAAAELFLPDYKPRGNSSFDYIFGSRALQMMFLPRSVATQWAGSLPSKLCARRALGSSKLSAATVAAGCCILPQPP